ncbi:MAG TPA: hypothetical protein VM509_14405 [Planctomycetota bacterium]|nr:hypothetical protein [Planctomycetota bacterium]
MRRSAFVVMAGASFVTAAALFVTASPLFASIVSLAVFGLTQAAT